MSTKYACTCKAPYPYTRPSGKDICLGCGGDIVAETPPEVRP